MESTLTGSKGLSATGRIILTIILFLLSFPYFEPEIATGLDASYVWALNYFFAHGVQFGRDVMFTWGPLSFIQIAVIMGNNLLYSIIIVSAIRLYFILYFFTVAGNYYPTRWQVHAFCVLIICYLSKTDSIFAVIAALSVLDYSLDEKKVFRLYPGIIATVVGILIKIPNGITPLLILLSAGLIFLVRKKNTWVLLHVIGGYIVVFLAIWLALYHNLYGVFNYHYSILQFSISNSNGNSLSPPNHWWLLAGFAICLFLVPVIIKEYNTRLLYAIFFLPLFSLCKYAMSREENGHLRAFVFFLIVFIAIILAFTDRYRYCLFGLLAGAVMLFYENAVLTGAYNVGDSVKLIGIDNFSRVSIRYNKLVTESTNLSKQNLLADTLPQNLRSIIGNKTVDCYPWEISLVPANNLNYKSMPVLQTVFSPWLDRQDADYFKKGDGADFIIWHGNNDSTFGNSYDTRYLLNDGPLSIDAIFGKYKIVAKGKNYLLFAKSTKGITGKTDTLTTIKAGWNDWIDVPPTMGITKASLSTSRKPWQILKSAFYKEGEFHIEYMLENGQIVNHRFILANAPSGLWISPYIQNINNVLVGKAVKKIRFTHAGNDAYYPEISVQWMNTQRQ